MKRSGWKYPVRLLLQTAFVLLMLELLLRIIFYQQFGLEKTALIESVLRVKQKLAMSGPKHLMSETYLLARPDSSSKVNEDIFNEVMASNTFAYHPWSEFKNTDFGGKYINTSNGQRACVPDKYINPSSSLQPLTVRFFGGSTMYGFNATDAETIPSAFIRLYKQKYPEGRSLEVINNGVCAYHSYNELMFFSHLIFSGHKTDIAIFLDGLNDLYMVKAVMERLSYFYHRLEMANSEDVISKKQILKTIELRQSLFGIPDYLAGKNVEDSLVARYQQNVEHIKKVSLINNCRSFFFIQPTPFFNYPNRGKDPICTKEVNAIIENGYAALERYADTSKNIIFLGNMLKAETGLPFIDKFHYSPAMSQRIAEEMLSHIGPEINQKF